MSLHKTLSKGLYSKEELERELLLLDSQIARYSKQEKFAALDRVKSRKNTVQEQLSTIQPDEAPALNNVLNTGI